MISVSTASSEHAAFNIAPHFAEMLLGHCALRVRFVLAVEVARSISAKPGGLPFRGFAILRAGRVFVAVILFQH